MFISLDKKRKKFSQWLKRKTTIDFSDWGILILFLLGLFVIFYFKDFANVGTIISSIVLWFTAIAILQYTKETYWLKQISQKQLRQNEREELVRNRAYLTVQNCHLSFSKDDIDRNATMKVVFNLINKGATPAQKITVRKYFTSPAPREKRFGEYPIGSTQNHLVPDHVHRYQFPFSDWDLNFASETPTSERFLVIEVVYSDYHEKQHILTSRYQVHSKESGSSLILKERYEEDL